MNPPSSVSQLAAHTRWSSGQHFVLFWFNFRVTLSGTQDLLLALYSVIIPGGVWGTIWNAGDQSQVYCLQDKCPTHHIIFFFFPCCFLSGSSSSPSPFAQPDSIMLFLYTPYYFYGSLQYFLKLRRQKVDKRVFGTNCACLFWIDNSEKIFRYSVYVCCLLMGEQKAESLKRMKKAQNVPSLSKMYILENLVLCPHEIAETIYFYNKPIKFQWLTNVQNHQVHSFSWVRWNTYFCLYFTFLHWSSQYFPWTKMNKKNIHEIFSLYQLGAIQYNKYESRGKKCMQKWTFITLWFLHELMSFLLKLIYRGTMKAIATEPFWESQLQKFFPYCNHKYSVSNNS